MGDGENAAREDRLEVGDLVAGKYRIEARLGEGGMGFVLAARHVHLDQRVAIKLMHASLAAHPEAVERFMREGRSSVAMKGEHVARVFDVDVLPSGAPYMVMEHLDGLDFDAVLHERGPLSLPEALLYLLQTCEAVAEAHARGIVHRDLKPSNLFVTQRPDGSPAVKVLDFGIAKAIDGKSGADSKLTRTGAMVGSPGYMSPEQVRNSAAVDARSDIWSLGVILYEALAGAIPFEGESAGALCAAIVADEPRPLDELRAELPAGVVAAVMRCLRKSRDERFANVGELAEALATSATPEAARSAERAIRLCRQGLADPDASGRWTGGALGAPREASVDDSFANTVAAGATPIRDGAEAAGTVDGVTARPLDPAPWAWPRALGVAAIAVVAAVVVWLVTSSSPPSATTKATSAPKAVAAPPSRDASAGAPIGSSRGEGGHHETAGDEGGSAAAAAPRPQSSALPPPVAPRKPSPAARPAETPPSSVGDHDEILLDRK